MRNVYSRSKEMQAPVTSAGRLAFRKQFDAVQKTAGPLPMSVNLRAFFDDSNERRFPADYDTYFKEEEKSPDASSVPDTFRRAVVGSGDVTETVPDWRYDMQVDLYLARGGGGDASFPAPPRLDAQRRARVRYFLEWKRFVLKSYKKAASVSTYTQALKKLEEVAAANPMHAEKKVKDERSSGMTSTADGSGKTAIAGMEEDGSVHGSPSAFRPGHLETPPHK